MGCSACEKRRKAAMARMKSNGLAPKVPQAARRGAYKKPSAIKYIRKNKK